jgi:hypothetical protein
MTYKTLEGVLHPDGQVRLPQDVWPQRPVRVLVTILEEAADDGLAEPGDYLEQLTDYEERLALGQVQWRKAV